MHFELTLDHLCKFLVNSGAIRYLTSNMVAISGSASSTTEDVRCQVVDLLAVFVANNGAASGAGVRSKSHAVLRKIRCRFENLR